MLVERRGLLVTRGDIVDRLWGKDVFVDVETGVHTAIRKIRQALRDSAEEPVCIETVSGKGYRFIAPVEVVGAESPPAPADSLPARCGGGAGSSPNRPRPGGGSGPGRHHRLGRAWPGQSAVERETCRAPVREPQRRSGSRLPGGRPDRGNDRIAGPGRSRPRQRRRPYVRHDLRAGGEIRGRDRARAERRLSGREFHSRRKRPVAHHGQADSRARPGPGVVADLQPRPHQHAGVAAGTQRRDRRTDPVHIVARPGGRADAAPTEKRRGLRSVSARTELRQPAHAADDAAGDRALPARHPARSRLRPRLVGARRHLWLQDRSTAMLLRSRSGLTHARLRDRPCARARRWPKRNTRSAT